MTVAVVLLFVVNPEVRALVFLVDALSLDVFLLFVGLQVKTLWPLVKPTVVQQLASLARLSAAGLRHFSSAVNALNPRIPLAFLAQQALSAARIQLEAGVCRTRIGRAA